LRICFIATELFHWGEYGGYGFLTRTLGRELVKRGVEVFVVMPRSSNRQRLIEVLDGMIVLAIPGIAQSFTLLGSLRHGSSFKQCQADICHSESVTASTYLAIKANPEKKHIITFQDPRDKSDRIKAWSIANPEQSLRYINFRQKLLVKQRIEDYYILKAIHNADALFCQAKYIIPKVTQMYKLSKQPEFLPNPVKVPDKAIKKADKPTVCFLGRLDPIKRPEIFFELARKFPDVSFVTIGKAQDEDRDRYLREKYSKTPNIEFAGFLTGKEKSEILDRSWVLINTSIYECLPVSFLEAAAHKCAILSHQNPDDFARNFGYHVTYDDLTGFSQGLEFLLEQRHWKKKGEEAYRYVKDVHEKGKVIDMHINLYKEMLER